MDIKGKNVEIEVRQNWELTKSEFKQFFYLEIQCILDLKQCEFDFLS